MSDLFTNLASAATGARSLAHPLIGPRYGPPPPLAGDEPPAVTEAPGLSEVMLAPLAPRSATGLTAALPSPRELILSVAHVAPAEPTLAAQPADIADPLLAPHSQHLPGLESAESKPDGALLAGPSASAPESGAMWSQPSADGAAPASGSRPHDSAPGIGFAIGDDPAARVDATSRNNTVAAPHPPAFSPTPGSRPEEVAIGAFSASPLVVEGIEGWRREPFWKGFAFSQSAIASATPAADATGEQPAAPVVVGEAHSGAPPAPARASRPPEDAAMLLSAQPVGDPAPTLDSIRKQQPESQSEKLPIVSRKGAKTPRKKISGRDFANFAALREPFQTASEVTLGVAPPVSPEQGQTVQPARSAEQSPAVTPPVARGEPATAQPAQADALIPSTGSMGQWRLSEQDTRPDYPLAATRPGAPAPSDEPRPPNGAAMIARTSAPLDTGETSVGEVRLPAQTQESGVRREGSTAPRPAPALVAPQTRRSEGDAAARAAHRTVSAISALSEDVRALVIPAPASSLAAAPPGAVQSPGWSQRHVAPSLEAPRRQGVPQQPAPPAIRVTIGTVEVRAEAPPALPARPPRRAPGSALAAFLAGEGDEP
jgi:hypothetical protein